LTRTGYIGYGHRAVGGPHPGRQNNLALITGPGSVVVRTLMSWLSATMARAAGLIVSNGAAVLAVPRWFLG